MGSFASTCAVSGLPLEAGDAVRFFLLTENPYERNRGIHRIHDLWVPRTFPLRAKYNNYGGVENAEEGAERDLWLQGFQLDLVERGWGDNSAHDVPVSKEMDFEALLGALDEGRIQVRRKVDTSGVEKIVNDLRREAMVPKAKVPIGVPTRRRVTRALEKAGLFDGSHEFLVDRRHYGEIRVRYRGDDPSEIWLLKAAEVLRSYATMISAGEGRYADWADLTVRPLPNTNGFRGRGSAEKKAPLLVRSAMIREDVWQALLKFQVENWTEGVPSYSIVDFRKFVRDYASKEAAFRKKAKQKKDIPADVTDLLASLQLDNEASLNPAAAFVVKDALPFQVGLGTHWKMMRNKSALFLTMAAEFALIHRVLMSVRYWWHPSYSCGPQFGEWRSHREFLGAMFQVAAERE